METPDADPVESSYVEMKPTIAQEMIASMFYDNCCRQKTILAPKPHNTSSSHTI